MKNRNYIDEIIQKKTRLESGLEKFDLIYLRLDDLENLGKFYKRMLNDGVTENWPDTYESRGWGSAAIEGIKYIPVGLIACVESFFKFAFAMLIDSHERYRNRAADFDIKYSLKTAIDLEANKLSVGEFVSHFLRVNRLSDINAHLSQILGTDFLKGFKTKRGEMDLQSEMFPLNDEEKAARLLSSIENLFAIRHQVCHEAALPIDTAEVMSLTTYASDVREFLHVSETYLREHIEANKLLNSDAAGGAR